MNGCEPWSHTVQRGIKLGMVGLPPLFFPYNVTWVDCFLISVISVEYRGTEYMGISTISFFKSDFLSFLIEFT
jgi:hypothetical protein